MGKLGKKLSISSIKAPYLRHIEKIAVLEVLYQGYNGQRNYLSSWSRRLNANARKSENFCVFFILLADLPNIK